MAGLEFTVLDSLNKSLCCGNVIRSYDPGFLGLSDVFVGSRGLETMFCCELGEASTLFMGRERHFDDGLEIVEDECEMLNGTRVGFDIIQFAIRLSCRTSRDKR
jgi:hypothetical protein